MNSQINYNFDGRALRVVYYFGDAWLVFADVAAILGLKNPRDALNALSEEDKFITFVEIEGKRYNTTVVYGIAVDEMLRNTESANAIPLIDFLNNVVFEDAYGPALGADESAAAAQTELVDATMNTFKLLMSSSGHQNLPE